MGNQLAALARLPRSDLELSTSARLVLVTMAAMARDDDPEPTYFGGWPYLAGALGYDVYDNAAHLKVRRAVRQLRDVKLISTTGRSAPGVRVGYRLHLTPWGAD